MQETFILTVQTEDGRWSMEQRITCDWLGSALQLSHVSSLFRQALEDSLKSETLPGSGTGPSALGSSSHTEL